MQGQRRGIDRERKVREVLEAEGWVTVRAAGSLGPVDVVAVRALYQGVRAIRPLIDPEMGGSEVMFIEVKSTADGPYKNFGPTDRRTIIDLAIKAGATATLAWWPPRGKLQWIPSINWPSVRGRAETPVDGIYDHLRGERDHQLSPRGAGERDAVA